MEEEGKIDEEKVGQQLAKILGNWIRDSGLRNRGVTETLDNALKGMNDHIDVDIPQDVKLS
ncbi:MAG: hypothetical protein WC028_02880 [Candidatus Obscuribacterales bacterium]